MVHQRVLFSLATLTLGAFILLISVIRIAQPELFAQNTTSNAYASELVSNQEASTPAQLASEEDSEYYKLPYPGILPDHPLYWLKMLRDRIKLLITSNPLLKAELQLLYADKRLGAGQALISGGRPSLGISTLSKGEKYLKQACDQIQQISQSQEIDPNIITQFAKAAYKHKQTLQGINNQLPTEYQQQLQDTIILNQDHILTPIKPHLPPELRLQNASPSAQQN